MEFINQFQDYELNLHGVRVPVFKIDDDTIKRLGLLPNASNYSVLEALSTEGFVRLLKDISHEEKDAYYKRLEIELTTFKELEFVDYLLLVWDVIAYCKKENIPVGIGRGSCCGSLVLYLIGVTGIDPIKYGLYFERFISKTRAKKKIVDGVCYLDGSLMCDIDEDICFYNRGKVLTYLDNKFAGRTCKISTLNTLQGKLLIKECGKIIANYSEHEMHIVADWLPQIFGKVKDLESAYKEIPEFKAWADNNKETYQIALGLRGLIKNKSCHASATMLSYDPLDESCPVELTTAKEIISAYDMQWATLFNLKLDLLGLRAVSVIDDVCKQIGVKASDINLNDPSVYALLQELEAPHGLFQIEADSLSRSVRQIKPKCLEHLSGVIAVCRPGASQFIDQYADFVNSGEAQSVHPFFDDVLKDTGNLAIYQEQLMAMVKKIGFSLEEAELVRRVTAKKKPEEVKVWKERIEEKVKINKLDPAISEIVWKICEDSANYSFNKSHSIAYAAMGAITCYLKAKHPKEFYLSLLKMTRHEPDPTSEITKIQQELPLFGIALLPPDLLQSSLEFKIEGPNIRFGLLSIKGIADKSIEKLMKFRKPHANKFETFKAAEESKLGLGPLTAMLQAGALSSLGGSRTRMVLEAQIWSLLSDNEKQWALKLAKDCNNNLVKVVKALCDIKDDKGKPVIKPSRLETLRRHYAEYKEIYQINSKSEDFANWFYERKCLGHSYSGKLMSIFGAENPHLIQVAEAKKADLDEHVELCGVIKEIKTAKSKKGTKYCKMLVSDESGEMTILLFDTERHQSIEGCKAQNGGRLPKEEQIIEIRGMKKEDAVFADFARCVDSTIYTKLADLREKKREDEKKLANSPVPA